MNEPYSRRFARNAAENQPLAARYTSAEPIRWNGSMIYPMYTEPLGREPKLLTMALLSAAPPAGLRGQGIGLSMVDGYIDLEGRRLGGVDVWSDALYSGVTFELTPTGPEALFTLTPVWVDALGVQKSWTGNYGILVEDVPDGRIALWCSIGEGPPNFANLVVALLTTPAPLRPAREIPPPEADGSPESVATSNSPDLEATEQYRLADVRPPPADPVPARPPAADLPVPGTGPEQQQRHAGPDPGYRNALYDLGVEMYKMGEEEQACGLWAQASAAGHSPAAYDLGVVRYRRGDFAGAEHWWRTAAELGEARAMAGLSELLDRQGNHAEAQLWRTRAAEEAGRSARPPEG
ncbi:tetratricopeptide repeat protein [Nocardia arizonensis]|uniref:tetratricopeptide repeat protein n=1 Tax=Nocardia arizonensis TaxID=1141647 RepID=UPI0006CFE1A0|nr:sel1 repeat family protein [Nocardia arizonensis]